MQFAALLSREISRHGMEKRGSCQRDEVFHIIAGLNPIALDLF